MARPVALRTSAIFILFAAAFALIGIASGAPLAEALFVISGSVCAAMLFFGLTAPAPRAVLVPVRARRRR